MDRGTETLRSGGFLSGMKILKGFSLYALFPILCLSFLARPIGHAVRGSDTAAFLILLASLGAVGLNWFVYAAVHRKRPSLLVFAYGIFCMLVIVIIEYEALLDTYGSILSTLSVIGGCLALTVLFLLSFWLASRRSKAAHSAAVVIWVIIGLVSVFMLYRILRDFESKTANEDTWISLVILAALIPAAFTYRIRSYARRRRARRRAVGLAEGKILQIIGETRLDRDDDLVTDYHALIRYTVGSADYQTRADIYGLTMRRFGKEAFIGHKIPVRYVPENPGEAYADRIDRHFFDQDRPGSETDPAE